MKEKKCDNCQKKINEDYYPKRVVCLCGIFCCEKCKNEYHAKMEKRNL